MLSNVPCVPHRLTVLFSSSVRHKGCLLSSAKTILASCNRSDSLLMLRKPLRVFVCYRRGENDYCRPLESAGRVFHLCHTYWALGQACKVALGLRILCRGASSRRLSSRFSVANGRFFRTLGICLRIFPFCVNLGWLRLQ